MEELILKKYHELIAQSMRSCLSWHIFEKAFKCAYNLFKDENKILIDERKTYMNENLHQRFRISELEDIINKCKIECKIECFVKNIDISIQDISRKDIDNWLND